LAFDGDRTTASLVKCSIECPLGNRFFGRSAKNTATEVDFDGDRIVAQGGGDRTVKPLNNTDTGRAIANLDPPDSPGNDRVKIEFPTSCRFSASPLKID